MADPFLTPPHFGPHKRLDATSFGWAGLLVPALLLSGAMPFNNAQSFPTAHHPSHRLSISDTSQGVPKTLTADAKKAFFVAPFLTPQAPGKRHWLNPDSSRSTPKTLFLDSTTPQLNPPWTPSGYLRGFSETSQSAPATLGLVVLPPVSNPPGFSAASRPSFTPDTSRGIAPPPTVAVPAINALSMAVARPPTAGDTSQSTPKVLYADALSPFFNPPQATLDRIRPVTGYSQIVIPQAAVLNPFVNPPGLAIGRSGQTADTSQSTFRALAFVAPGVPFAQTRWPNAAEFRLFGRRTELLVWTIPPAAPVVVAEYRIGGTYGLFDPAEQRRKRKKKIADELIEVAPVVAPQVVAPPAVSTKRRRRLNNKRLAFLLLLD